MARYPSDSELDLVRRDLLGPEVDNDQIALVDEQEINASFGETSIRQMGGEDNFSLCVL